MTFYTHFPIIEKLESAYIPPQTTRKVLLFDRQLLLAQEANDLQV